MGQPLDENLKLYNSLKRELKLKVRKIWWLIRIFGKVTTEKLVEEGAGESLWTYAEKKFKIYMIYKSKTMRADCVGENLICY